MTSLSFGKHLLTEAEVAQLLRCSVVSVRRLLRRRALARVKPFGPRGKTLVRAIDLQAYLDRSRLSAVGENSPATLTRRER